MRDPRSYKEAAELLQGRCADRQKLANNTWLERRGEDIAVRLHSTDVVTYLPDGSAVYDSGGWKTMTTKDRMNRFGPRGFAVWSIRGVWYVGRPAYGTWSDSTKDGAPFTDGIRIGPRGGIHGAATASELKERKELKVRIRAYAALCADSIPLPMPGGGDCFYCHMQTESGETLGDASNDTSHLDSHMEEGYVVPSLVWRALEETHCGPAYYAAAFREVATGSWADTMKRGIRNAVLKFLAKRYGLAMRGS